MSVIDYISNLPRPSIAMRFNGVYFEEEVLGYRTNKVTGRESLQSAVAEKMMDIKDSSLFLRNRRLSRDIEIEFSIVTDTQTEYRQSVNKLKSLCTYYGKNQVESDESIIIFDDESDLFYKGSVTSITLDELVDHKSGSGKIMIHCTDGCKYSIEEYTVPLNTLDEGTEFYYDGTYMSYPTLKAEIQYGQGLYSVGYFAFINQDGKIIQIGVPEEVDIEDPRTKSEVIFNDNFKTMTWTETKQGANPETASDQSNVGRWYTNTTGINHLITVAEAYHASGWSTNATNALIPSKALHAKSFVANTGDLMSGWHGPAITTVSSKFVDSHNNSNHVSGTLEVKATMVTGTNDFGEFVMSLDHFVPNTSPTDRTALAKLVFYKKKAGTNKGTCNVMMYNSKGNSVETSRGGKTMTYFEFDSGPNGNTTKATVVNNADGAVHKITKIKDKVTFDINGQRIAFTDPEIENLTIDSVTFAFAQYGNKTPITNNVVHTAKFTSHSVNDEKDIPNKFIEGDVITADTSTGRIAVNGLIEYGLGALANDWETFFLRPGLNKIVCTYSNVYTVLDDDPYHGGMFSDPIVSLTYRKAYL